MDENGKDSAPSTMTAGADVAWKRKRKGEFSFGLPAKNAGF